MNKLNLLNMNLAEMKAALTSIGEAPFRADQICDWVYRKKALTFNEMSNISAALQEKLAEHCTLALPTVKHVHKSRKDGSYKFLLETYDGKFVEAVLMLENGRATICLSSMIGCPLKCSFCSTGMEMKYERNLQTSEIMGQVLLINKYAQENGICERITNLVFMGMGEPLLNMEAVERTVDILLSDYGFGMSRTRITISTAGISDRMVEFVNKYRVRLAISLHFTTDEERTKFMPINKKFPLKELLNNARQVELLSHDYITIEYIMIRDVNDTLRHARELVKLLEGIKVKVNLIPLNPISTFNYVESTEEKISEFLNYLSSRRIIATVRRSKGRDVAGGCGQLAVSQQQGAATPAPQGC